MEQQPKMEKFVSGEAIYLGKAEEYKERLDQVETKLAEAGNEVTRLEQERDELIKLIKNEEQTRLN